MTKPSKFLSGLLGLLFLAACSERPANISPDSPAAPDLIRLRDGDPVARESAAIALGRAPHADALPLLLNAARSDHQIPVRVAAIHSLAAYEAAGVGETLLGLLHDPSEMVRLKAVQSLGRLRWSGAAAALAGVHRAEASPAVRQSALAALAGIGGEAFDALVAGFPDLEAAEQSLVLEAILENADPGGIEALLVSALAARSAPLRVRAAQALISHGGDNAVPALLALLEDPLGEADHATRERRLRQGPTRFDIQQIKNHLDGVLRRNNRNIHPGVHDWLERDAERAKREFVSLVERQRLAEVARVQEAVAGALLGLGTPTALTAMEGMLSSERPEIKEAALAAFRKSAATHLDGLYATLANADRPRVLRVQALDLLALSGKEILSPEASRGWDPRVLGNALTGAHSPERSGDVPRDTRFLDALADRLGDADAAVSARAALTLLRRGDERGLPSVIALLENPEGGVRLEAIRALGARGRTPAVPALVQHLARSRANPERIEALEALGRVGDSSTLPHLLPFATDASHPAAVRRAALAALGEIGDPAPGAALATLYETLGTTKPDQWNRLREDLLEVAGAIKSKDLLPTLVKVVEDYQGFGHVREAMRSLGRIGDPSAFPALDAALRKPPLRLFHDVDQVADAYGIPALVGLGDPRGIDTLLFLARREGGGVSTPATAIRALAEFPQERAVEELIRLLADPEVGPALQESAVAPAILRLGERAVPALARLLREAPSPVDPGGVDPGMYAAELLAHLGDPGAEALFSLSADAHSLPPHVLGRLVESLQRLGDVSRVSKSLAGFLRHGDPQVRRWTVVGLGNLRTDIAREALRGALEDGDAEVRHWAARALDPNPSSRREPEHSP